MLSKWKHGSACVHIGRQKKSRKGLFPVIKCGNSVTGQHVGNFFSIFKPVKMRACQSCVRLPSKQKYRTYTIALESGQWNQKGAPNIRIISPIGWHWGGEYMWLALCGGAVKQRPIMVMKCRLSASADYKRVSRVTSSYQFISKSYFRRHRRSSRLFSGRQTRTPTLYALLITEYWLRPVVDVRFVFHQHPLRRWKIVDTFSTSWRVIQFMELFTPRNTRWLIRGENLGEGVYEGNVIIRSYGCLLLKSSSISDYRGVSNGLK